MTARDSVCFHTRIEPPASGAGPDLSSGVAGRLNDQAERVGLPQTRGWARQSLSRSLLPPQQKAVENHAERAERLAAPLRAEAEHDDVAVAELDVERGGPAIQERFA